MSASDFIYSISKAVWFVIQPGNLVFLLLTAAAALSWIFPRMNYRIWLTGLAISLALIAFLPIEIWIARPLEDRFQPPANLPERIDGIIVLGGILNSQITRDRDTLTVYENAERIMVPVTLAIRHPEARLVISGRGENHKALMDWFSTIGVDVGRITFETGSRNTFENAVFSNRQIRPSPDEIWLLVTSAHHMPRAVGVFRKLSWPIIPYPVDYRTSKAKFLESWPNLAVKLWHINNSLKEWIGLVGYYTMGRTDDLFPKPSRNQT